MTLYNNEYEVLAWLDERPFFCKKYFVRVDQKPQLFEKKVCMENINTLTQKMTILLSYIVLTALIISSLYFVGLIIYLDLKNNRVMVRQYKIGRSKFPDLPKTI